MNSRNSYPKLGTSVYKSRCVVWACQFGCCFDALQYYDLALDSHQAMHSYGAFGSYRIHSRLDNTVDSVARASQILDDDH